MSLKRNIVANYISQFYGTLIGIVMVPMYVHYMGVEAYGLIGFFAMLQVWFQLLDMGLTPTLARETTRLISDAPEDARKLRRLLRSLEGLFICIALAACVALMLGAGGIAEGWLKVQRLPLAEVRQSVSLMALNIGLRWVSGLYRGAITGFERLVWLNGLNVLLATARFFLVIFVFIFIGTSPVDFFAYQLAIAILELGLLVRKTYRLLPGITHDRPRIWQWKPLRDVFRFSLAMAIANLAWVMVTQSDKLLLSKLLPLDEYARFSLAALMASGIFMLSNPYGMALLPRLTKLFADESHKEFLHLYHESTQLVAVIVIPATLILGLFSEQVMWVWTGNAGLANQIAPVLSLYALGNGMLALGTFPYYLQFAKGDLRLHVIGTVLLVVALLPAIFFATRHYGVIGAGYAWAGVNALYFLFWLPNIHERFAKGMHAIWLQRDIGVIFVTGMAVALPMRLWITWPTGRVADGLGVAVVGVILLGSRLPHPPK